MRHWIRRALGSLIAGAIVSFGITATAVAQTAQVSASSAGAQKGQVTPVPKTGSRQPASSSSSPPAPLAAFDAEIVPQFLCGRADDFETNCDIVPNQELFITELCVVEDPCRTRWTNSGLCATNSHGAWTFGTLMAHMAGFQDVDENPAALSQFVRGWLEQIQTTQTINGFTVTGRPGIASFLSDWETVSGVGKDGVLDMRLAPFRLLAIVNRMDLRQRPGAGGYGAGNAGEGRFVFGFLQVNFSQPNDPDAWFSRPATVIMEYFLPASTCDEVLDWAASWHALGSLPFGSQYNAALQAVTDDFAGFNADPSRPNGSSLAQLRTNEISFGSPWELREFKLQGFLPTVYVPLTEVTVAQTVDLSHDNSALLGRYVTQDELDILHDEHTIPLQFEGQPFRAGSSINPSTQFFWDVPGFDCTETRFKYAINNCNGCHSREAGVPNFLQVNPRSIGNEALLAAFLTGDFNGVTDPTCPPPPDNGAVTRHFNDIQRRGLDLCDLLNASCAVVDIDGIPLFFATKNISTTVH